MCSDNAAHGNLTGSFKISGLLFKEKKIDTIFLVCIVPCISQRLFRKRQAADVLPESSSASLEPKLEVS